MPYLSWNEKTITDFSEKNVVEMYDHGYVFTRIGKGVMKQTRSARIDLSKFNLDSENRRILKKTEGLKLEPTSLPYKEYGYTIGKMAKDFYDTKFGPGTMSAQKIKETCTDPAKSNFNTLLRFNGIGFIICYANTEMLHYSYPFYDLEKSPKDMGMGMMVRAIEYAKVQGLKYIYLGSIHRPTDTYKFQFAGLEWFDGEKWSEDLEKAKEVLAK